VDDDRSRPTSRLATAPMAGAHRLRRMASHETRAGGSIMLALGVHFHILCVLHGGMIRPPKISRESRRVCQATRPRTHARFFGASRRLTAGFCDQFPAEPCAGHEPIMQARIWFHGVGCAEGAWQFLPKFPTVGISE
jgi:hypothetical protein